MAEVTSTSNSEPVTVKVICLGDSAVGKSKLVERFLMDRYKPQPHSTYAVTLFNYEEQIDGQKVKVDLWDTAGQERFNTLHPSYYYQAHACIMVFDVTRKVTYKNLSMWYSELRQNRPKIPCLLVANKIDSDYSVTERTFKFAKKHKLPLYYVSAADGTNVVKLFRAATKAAILYKENSDDFLDQIMEEIQAMSEESTYSKDKMEENTVEEEDSERSANVKGETSDND